MRQKTPAFAPKVAALLMCLAWTLPAWGAPASPPLFGVNEEPVWMTPDQLAKTRLALQELGPTWLRMNIRWVGVEPVKGQWRFDQVDSTLAQIPTNAHILCVLLDTPGWANGGQLGVYAPTNLIAWSNYVYTVVGRYRDRIRHWEVLNEPNGQDFFQPQPNPVRYTQLLRLAYQAAKLADPTCVVVFGGMQGNGVDPFRWQPVKVANFLEDVYLAGGKDFFDVCATHPYVTAEEGAAQILATSRKTLDVMARYGDGTKPLWLTEIGFGGVDQIAQAKLLCETFRIPALEPRIQKIMWFGFSYGYNGSMSLLDQQWGRKASFRAFQAQTAAPDGSTHLLGGRSGERNFLFTLLGAPGADHRVEASADLRSWRTIWIASSETGFLPWNDFISAGPGAKYYRAQQLSSPCTASPSGLVAWWTGDETADDLVGGNHGSPTGSTGYAVGRVGSAFLFDGVDDCVTVPPAPALDFHDTNAVTLELWAYRTSVAPGQNLVGKRIGCTGAIQYQMSFNGQNGLVFGGNRPFVTTYWPLPLYQWTHLAGTFDGTTLKFYIDGNLVASTTGLLGPANDEPLKIGRVGDCEAFGGVLDEISLYDRALSEAEIRAIANAGRRGKCR